MTANFTVRKATSADEAQILECLALAFAPHKESYTPQAFADTILSPETLRQRANDMTLLVAADASGRVVGTVAYKIMEGIRGHIRGMAVRPECHGSGVARTLLDAVVSDLRALGCQVVTLNTTQPLQRAMRFYENYGFRPTGDKRSFFGMDLFLYRKAL